MRRNPNLAEYYTRTKGVYFAAVLFGLISIAYLASAYFSDEAKEIEFVSGLAIDSEERINNGVKKKYLTIELDDGTEVLVVVPSYLTADVGAIVKLTKTEASVHSGIKYRYRFDRYIN